jgi:hypothetical protein
LLSRREFLPGAWQIVPTGVEPFWQQLAGERALRVEGYLQGDPRTVFT